MKYKNRTQLLSIQTPISKYIIDEKKDVPIINEVPIPVDDNPPTSSGIKIAGFFFLLLVYILFNLWYDMIFYFLHSPRIHESMKMVWFTIIFTIIIIVIMYIFDISTSFQLNIVRKK